MEKEKLNIQRQSYSTFSPMAGNEQKQPLLNGSEENENKRSEKPYNNNEQTEVDIMTQVPENPHATSDAATMMHLLKGNIGTGLLSLPLAIQHAGIIFGPVLLLLMAIICVHCMRLLVKCSKHFCRQEGVPFMDYSTVMKMAARHSPIVKLQQHENAAGTLVNIFLMITQLGFCCVYFVFMAQNIRQVVIQYFPNSTPGDRIFMAMLFVPIALLSFIRHLKILAWFSFLANIATLVSLAIILRYVVEDLPAFNTRPYIANASTIPMFFGTAIYAFEGIGVILPIENEMRNPSHFPGILYSGMSVVSFLYISLGIIGYLKYGDTICGSITLNLPGADPLYQSVKIMFSFVIGATYAIQFYVPMQIVWRYLKRTYRPSKELCWQLVLRTTFVFLTCLLAIAIPNLGDYIALIGAFSSSFLALIFPPIIHILTFYSPASNEIGEPLIYDENNKRSKKMSKLTMIKDLVIMIIGLVGFLAGTIVAIQNIIKDLGTDDDSDKCSGGAGGITTTAPYYNVTTPAWHGNQTTSFSTPGFV